MKNLLYISFLIMLVLGCKNPKDIAFSQENIIITDTITKKNDTITKISNPFKINGIECYWKYSIFESDRAMILKDYKTDRVLLDYLGYIDSSWDYEPEDYFDKFNKDIFKDVNFDGYKDFMFQNIGNTTMNSSLGIFIFNNQTKTFEETTDENLYAQYLIEIDSINKKLILGNEFRHGTDSIINYFGKNGNIKFTEFFTGYSVMKDTAWVHYDDYTKIINGKIVETKRDSIIDKWE